MRSFLTMLGIIIGVAAVIVLVSLVDGMKKDMVKTFESMGTNLITVSIRGRGGNRAVSADDMQELVFENSEVLAAMSPAVTIGNATIKYESNNVTSGCIGVNEYYEKVKNSEVEFGRNISYIDVETRQRNCVIGTYIKKELFDGEDPLGQTIKINNMAFQVVGVLKEKQGGTEGGADHTIIVPYTIAQKLARMSVSSYNFSAADKDQVDKAVEVIEDFLLGVFSNSRAYSVYNQAESLKQVNELTGTMTMVLVGVAGISLLVGGIGIMNIMLVSVTERTREIGIRKSLGARPWDIMSQFVVEAITTSGIGGVMGIILGIVAAYGVAMLVDMTVSISAMAIIIAFSVSALIGVTFGYFPAKKAARLNPIDALRYD
ncbi:MAG: FtsX-like permease family protein [Ruminococcaceae bacterium]|nr:FtsX-like permease family protein [Oscillospiraceae bacterium]